MAGDANLILWEGGVDLDVTTDRTGTFVAVGGGLNLDAQVLIPEGTAADTLVVSLQYSADGTLNNRGAHFFDAVDGDDTDFPKILRHPIKIPLGVTHVRAFLDVTGSGEDFGAVDVRLGHFSERSDDPDVGV